MSKYDGPMMETAMIWANMSSCVKGRVGCVIASKDGRVLATGYNGTIAGMDNCCEDKIIRCANELFCDETHIMDSSNIKLVKTLSVSKTIIEKWSYTWKCPGCDCTNDIDQDKLDTFIEIVTNEFTLHAEQNAIVYAAKAGIPINNTTIYVTMSPCKTCAKLIAQSGITRVVYGEKYKDTAGIEFLTRVGVEVVHYYNEEKTTQDIRNEDE